MNRADLQTLSRFRLEDGKALLDAGRFEGAYYVLGYAVECGLKAAIARQIREHDFPDRKLVQDIHTHDLGKLLALSGLKGEFDRKVRVDRAFNINWGLTKDWNAASRYSTKIAEASARDLYSAITDSVSGVLPWLMKLW